MEINKKIKISIVGGNFDTENGKKSSVISKLGENFNNASIYNGGNINNIENIFADNGFKESDLIIWMPNIQNETPKNYPNKKRGSVLICSKIMRDNYTRVDAISRIFKMHGNAVIAITKDQNIFTFELIDALGNTWYKGSQLNKLSDKILEFYSFTKSAIRLPSIKISTDSDDNIENYSLEEFIGINKELQYKIETSCGNRFFGNISTRCQKLFPSLRYNSIYVSPRNSNKKSLTTLDMVKCFLHNNTVFYYGNNKPSVDTPIQLAIYDKYPNINFMIHGHAKVKNAPTTSNYCLCGDFNEVNEISELIDDTSSYGIINLKKHGFLIYANNTKQLVEIITNNEFYY